MRSTRESPPLGGAEPPASTGAELPGEPGIDLAAVGDRILVARAAEGDDDAFAVLVHRHSGRLLALAYHMLGNLSDAEEAVQEASSARGDDSRIPPGAPRSAPGCTESSPTGASMSAARPPLPSPLEPFPNPRPTTRAANPPGARKAGGHRRARPGTRHLPPGQRVCWMLRELNGPVLRRDRTGDRPERTDGPRPALSGTTHAHRGDGLMALDDPRAASPPTGARTTAGH